MRILVVGAGAIGGYFGGRLLEAGADVTFLVRPQRAAQLARTGLQIRSPFGDLAIASAPLVTADALRQTFDVIFLSCKAYDLDGAMDSFAPAVSASTAILPLLNGMRHLEMLDARFGAQHVLGGQCVIAATLDAEGSVLHLNEAHALSFGERDGSRSARVASILAAMAGANFDARLSERIVEEMWEKWVFIAAVAGITCLMRASIGDIVAADAGDVALQLFDECAGVAATQGFAPNELAVARGHRILTTAGSALTASLLRDIERGARTEADHIIGDFLRRGGRRTDDLPVLRIVNAHLEAYEARRAREAGRA